VECRGDLRPARIVDEYLAILLDRLLESLLRLVGLTLGRCGMCRGDVGLADPVLGAVGLRGVGESPHEFAEARDGQAVVALGEVEIRRLVALLRGRSAARSASAGGRRSGGGRRARAGRGTAACRPRESVQALGELVEASREAVELGAQAVEPRRERLELLGVLGGLLAGPPIELAHHRVRLALAPVHGQVDGIEILAELRDVVLRGLVARAAGEEDPENNSGEPEAPRWPDASVHALPVRVTCPSSGTCRAGSCPSNP